MTTPDSFRAQLSALRDDVLAHARHEEEDVFPALNTSADELKKLGERYEGSGRRPDLRSSSFPRHAAGEQAARPGHLDDRPHARGDARLSTSALHTLFAEGPNPDLTLI